MKSGLKGLWNSADRSGISKKREDCVYRPKHVRLCGLFRGNE